MLKNNSNEEKELNTKDFLYTNSIKQKIVKSIGIYKIKGRDNLSLLNTIISKIINIIFMYIKILEIVVVGNVINNLSLLNNIQNTIYINVVNIKETILDIFNVNIVQ